MKIIKKDNTKIMKKFVAYSLIFLIFIIFGIKIILIKNNTLDYQEKLALKTNIYVYGKSAPRGRILDVNGKVLVDNLGVKTIYYNKIKGINNSYELEIAEKLASILSDIKGNISDLKKYYLITNNNGRNLITKEEYQLYNERKLTNDEISKLKLERITDEMIDYSDREKNKAYIYALMNEGLVYSKKEIKKNVSEEEYAKIIEANIPGVTGELSWERIYLYGNTLKNILGSIGSIPKEKKELYLSNDYELTDTVGISYLEWQYEDYLKGKKAKYQVNNDYTLNLVEEEKSGSDLILSIDIDLQLKVEEILKEKILMGQGFENADYYKDSYAIISNPKTGAILAIGGMRLNDDGSFSDIGLNNINKSFTIGSAVKGATIAVGYKYNLIESGAYITDSCVKLWYVPKKCSWKRLGRVNDLTALAQSSNYYQYMIAIKLTGNDYKPNMKLNATSDHFKMYRDMLASFGLGVKTEIDLPNEQIGIIGKTVADDLLLNLAIGQYDTYTPIEMIQYINSIASGNRLKLSLMNKITNNGTDLLIQDPIILNPVNVDNEALMRIRKGMKLVLSEGTGSSYVPKGLDFAGKTGTSESFLDSNGDGLVDAATITSTFAGFYPESDPKYSIVVITPNVSHKEGKTNKKYGGARKITKDIVEYLESNTSN